MWASLCCIVMAWCCVLDLHFSQQCCQKAGRRECRQSLPTNFCTVTFLIGERLRLTIWMHGRSTFQTPLHAVKTTVKLRETPYKLSLSSLQGNACEACRFQEDSSSHHVHVNVAWLSSSWVPDLEAHSCLFGTDMLISNAKSPVDVVPSDQNSPF